VSCEFFDTIEAMSESLHAPWRIEYLRSLEKPEPGECFMCIAARAANDEDRRKSLILWTTDKSIVMLNKFPYVNGHLLVLPKEHLADLEQLDDATSFDLQKQTTEAVKLLKRALSPQGFNIGTNLGRCAGAGVPGHIHQHIVPRWAGDTNFISVVGNVRIIPQATTQLYDELMRVRST
jgi:ATP adenylyltransferase